MLKRYLFALFFCIFSTSIPSSAQCPGSFACDAAGVLCAIDQLNGFRCNNPVTPNTMYPFATLCFGVGVPHNLNWWAFVGNGSPLTLTFNLDPASCEQGQGIQAGVFEGSCDGSTVWDCNAYCNSSTFTLGGTTQNCETYYVWVDGCNGDVCTYTMSVNGNGGPPRLPPLPPLMTRDPVCPCNMFEVCAPDLGDCLPTFEWTVNGIAQGRDYCVLVDVPSTAAPGSRINVCLKATIGNPDNPAAICDADSICTPFIVAPIDTIVEPCEVVCYEDQPFVWQGVPITSSCIVPPCSTRLQGPDGCCDDVSKAIVLLSAPSVGKKDTFICNVGIPFVGENGRVYPDEVCDEIIEFKRRVIHAQCPTSFQMCDTSYYLNIGRFKYNSDPKVVCGGCDSSVSISANVEYDPDCPNFLDSVGYELRWFKDTASLAMDTTDGMGSISVNEFGRYCAEIWVWWRTDTCQVNGDICIHYDSTFAPKTPEVEGPLFICDDSIQKYQLTNIDSACEYLWTIPEGGGSIVTSNSMDSSAIRVDWSSRVGGQGRLCVEIRDGCGESQNCFEIYFDTLQVLGADTINLCLGDSIKIFSPGGIRNPQWSSGETSDSITVSEAGQYCVAGTGLSSSCEVIKCFYVNEISVSVTDTFIENEWAPFKGRIEPVLQTNDSITDILWSNGATTLNIDSLQAGVYTLVVTTQQGCKFTFVFEVKMTTNTEEEKELNTYAIIPNPHYELRLWPALNWSELKGIELYDLHGKKMIDIEGESELSACRVLSEGVYLVRIISGEGEAHTLKWVKSRK